MHERFFSRIISARGHRAFISGDVPITGFWYRGRERFRLPLGSNRSGVCLDWSHGGVYHPGGRPRPIWGFLRSRALDKMALDTKIDSHVEMAHNKLNKENQNKSQNSKEE